MKVLVTGGAGFIGSHIVDACLAQGHNVVVVDDLSTGSLDNLQTGVEFHEMDVRSPELVKLLRQVKPDAVSHQAGQVNLRRSVSTPLYDASINVMGSLNLLECAWQAGVKRIVFASSGGAVYGEPANLPCSEDDAANPISPYGTAKRAVEHYLFAYAAMHGLEYLALRYANVYGPRQDPAGEAGVVAIFASQMLQGEQVTINGTGEQERDFIYVRDCARANLLALSADTSNTILNVGNGVGISVNDIFGLLKDITGYARDPVLGPSKVGETQKIFLDTHKAAEVLGFSPAMDFEEGLRQTVASLR